MMNQQFVPYEMKTSIIHILSYHHKNIEGYLENSFLKSPRYFENLTQMIFLIEQLLDARAFPLRGTSVRSFSGSTIKKNTCKDKFNKADDVPVASFRISVMFRQNSSWQGNIQWMEDKVVTPFRSVLELIQLMDSVLSRFDCDDLENET